MITSDRFLEILDRFSHVRLAVFGDYFLDKYLVIDPALNEPSVETGLDALQVVRVRHSPGAAGTVTNNLAGLEVGGIYAVGAIGDDGHGYELRQGLQRTGVDMEHLLVLDEMATPTYTKPMLIQQDGSECESHRLDIKNRRPLSETVQQRLLAELEAVLPDVQGVIIADQVAEAQLGVVTPLVREGLAELAAAHPEIIFFADSRANIGEFRNMIIKPNAHEAARLVSGDSRAEPSDVEMQAIGQELARRNAHPVFITLGANGILICEDSETAQLPAIPVPEPIDICGAGDSATAGIMAAMSAGASCREAAVFGTLVASITIQQIGTTGHASPPEVLQRFVDNCATDA